MVAITTIARVSDVLRLMDNSYENIPDEIMAVAQARGVYLHSLFTSQCASMLGLCEPPAPEEIEPEYLACYEGFMDWIRTNAFKPILVETRSTNEDYWYSGQPDVFGFKGPKRVPTIVDAKFTYAVLPINRVQVRAYRELPLYQEAEAMEIMKCNWETGEVKSEEVFLNGTGDFPAFLVALEKLRLLEKIQDLDEQLENWRQ